MRKTIEDFVKKEYGVTGDYPWGKPSSSMVLRHGDNQKWFALLMKIPGEKLGLKDRGETEIINLKCSKEMAMFLTGSPGIYPAYHMSHRNWISVLLDGTVEVERILDLLAESFLLTASKETVHERREAKAWIIPANPSHYDVEAGFRQGDILWHQDRRVKEGDDLFIYMGAPISALKYRCKVKAADLPRKKGNSGQDGKVLTDMLLELEEIYPDTLYPLSFLKEEGIMAVRSGRSMPDRLWKLLLRKASQ